MSDRAFLSCLAGGAGWILLCLVALITHVVVCIKSGALLLLLLIGVIAPPVGVIHGIGIWFRVF